MLGKLENKAKLPEIFLTAISWSVTLFVTFLIVIDVAGRYFFNSPLPATWEIGEICMPHIVFLPFAYALTKGTHVNVGMLTNYLSPAWKKKFKITTNLISVGMCSLLTYYSFIYFWDSFVIQEEMLAAVKLLWWWGKIALPMGMGLFTVVYILQTIDLIRNR